MSTISVIIPVYNAAEHIDETLSSVTSQFLPNHWTLEIVVVDDGSTDQSAIVINNFRDKRIRLIQRNENGGRAQARNTGIDKASGVYCIFIDADCSYLNRHAIHTYIRCFEKGIRACFGVVTSDGTGFWDWYQRDNYYRRLKNGSPLNLITTQNFGAEREALLNAGGFDVAYQKYGFEDRDLFLTLLKLLAQGVIRVDPSLKVCHRDHISLDQVCRKMMEAGRYSSMVFKKKFPLEYLKMNYARVDMRLLPAKVIPLCRLILRHRNRMRQLGNRLLIARRIPYAVKRFVVKTLSALYYMAGTNGSEEQHKSHT
jgi:glycosyltransferase involved in cell wall biosynthesis